ncbi:MAG: hypothetical protein RLZZ324_363 [Candidatus Parcubacteria bacterium]|jgi:GT2 family glycosyltransferase
MTLSIVILNYKTRGLTKQCVKTVLQFPPTRPYEIIVVDNASGDGTGEMLAERFPAATHPQIRFIQSPVNAGFAAGNNVGIRAAKGEYVMLMNPDIIVKPMAFDAMLAHMDANPDIGALGPKLVKPDGSLDSSCYRFPTRAVPLYRRTPLGRLAAGRKALSDYLMHDFDREGTTDVDWLLGAVLMVRRSAMEQVGLLDERFFLYFEDTDWCRRFWSAGWRVVYFAGARMVHFHERLSAQGSWFMGPFRRSTRVHIASWIRYFRKWPADDMTRGAKPSGSA